MSLLGSVYGIKSLASGAAQRIPTYERPPLYRKPTERERRS